MIAARLVACLLFWLMAGQAVAGAWSREAGSGFAAAAIQLGWPQDITTWTGTGPVSNYRTFYVEYGLTDRLTLGLDLGHAVSGAAKTVVFVQMPLWNRERGPKFAAQFGIGKAAGELVARPGLSAGMGLRNGWLALDSAAEFGLESGRRGLKADVTWGRKLAGDRKLIVQMQVGASDTDPAFARLAPSYVMGLTKRLQLEAGATWGLAGDDSMGLKLGLWSSF